MTDRHRPIALLARKQQDWRWKPDSWIEAAQAWLWLHPWVEAVAGGILFALFLLTCAWLLWR